MVKNERGGASVGALKKILIKAKVGGFGLGPAEAGPRIAPDARRGGRWQPSNLESGKLPTIRGWAGWRARPPPRCLARNGVRGLESAPNVGCSNRPTASEVSSASITGMKNPAFAEPVKAAAYPLSSILDKRARAA